MATTSSPQILAAESLIGDSVVDSVGELMGRMEELIVDPDQGRLIYAVLSFEPKFGMGDRLFAFPWPLLRYDAEGRRLVLHLPKEQLKTAPGFDRRDWPTMSDRDWNREIHRFYGLGQIWEEYERRAVSSDKPLPEQRTHH